MVLQYLLKIGILPFAKHLRIFTEDEHFLLFHTLSQKIVGEVLFFKSSSYVSQRIFILDSRFLDALDGS